MDAKDPDSTEPDAPMNDVAPAAGSVQSESAHEDKKSVSESPVPGASDWMGKPIELDADGLPKPLKWRPVFLVKALIFGFLFDLAAELVLQQLGKHFFTTYDFFHAAVVGLILGFVAPSLGRGVGVWWANRVLRQAREATA